MSVILIGFFFFFISLVPAHLQFIVKLLGFSGDRVKATELLQFSADVPNSGKSSESTLILFVLYYWFMDEQDKAPLVLQELAKKLPNSPVIYLATGWQALITDHNLDVAIESYNKAIEMTSLEQLKISCKAQLGYAYYLKEEWQTVCDTLLPYMEQTVTEEGKGYSSFAMGISKYMMNQNAECAEWMKKCVEHEDKTSNWDAYGAHVARAYLAAQNKFDRATILFLLIENANEAGQGEKSLKYLDELEKCTWEGFSNDDKMAMHAYFKGCALRLLGEVDKAKSQLIKAAGMHSKPLAMDARRAVPYSLIVLGEISMRELNQLDAASRFFSKAKGYSGKFFFSDIFNFRLRSNEEVLEAKRRKEKAAAEN